MNKQNCRFLLWIHSIKTVLMASSSVKTVLVEHPDCLVTKVMSWLSVADLGRCMRTCKDWNNAGSSDELWWALCSTRCWANSTSMAEPWHRRVGTVMGRMDLSRGPRPGNYERQVPIACPPQRVLPSTGHEEEAGGEGCSWQVRASALAEVLNWRGSLKASVLDLKRTQITDQELAGSTWALRFRLPPGANTAYVLGTFFRRDRKFIDAAIFPAEMPAVWSVQGSRVVLDAPGNPSIRQMLFTVTRLKNWGWHLYSNVYRVEIMSMHDCELIEAAAASAQLEWPTLVEEQNVGLEYETWKEYDVYAAEDETYYDPRDESQNDDFRQLLMGPNGENEGDSDDDYTDCYDSPAQYPESEQSDADAHDSDHSMPAGISPRSLQRTLNEMLLYDSYGSDDLTQVPAAAGGAGFGDEGVGAEQDGAGVGGEYHELEFRLSGPLQST